MDANTSDKQFFKEVCRFADCSNPATVAKYYNAIYEVIVRHLYYDDYVRVPLLGVFTLKELPETKQVQRDGKGGQVVYRVPARKLPVFAHSDDFVNDINMTGVTKAYRKRLKKGMLSKRDYERQARANLYEAERYDEEKKIEEAMEDFNQMLNDKKRKFEGKIEKDETE